MPRLVAHNGKGLECIGADSEAELPPGGAVLRSDAGGELTLRRFADEPTIEAGALAPGVAGRLGLDLDDATQRWVASIAPPGELEICSANPAEGE